MQPRAHLLAPVVLCALAVVVGACSSDDDTAASTTTLQLSAAARQGQELADSEGCTSCHQVSGDDGIGPPWAGLAGSEVELADGTVVVADEDYLTTAIVEPNAQVVKGYSGIMPQRTLDDDQVAALVAYLQALGATS